VKIGIVGTMAPWMSGGVAVHVAELVRVMRASHSVRVVTPFERGFHPRSVESTVRAIPLVPYLTAVNLIQASIRFFRDVDVIHSHDPRLAVTKVFLDKPLVTTFHGYQTLEPVANGLTAPGRPLYRIYDQLIRQCLRLSDRVISVDGRIARWLQETYSFFSADIVHNGVDASHFQTGGDRQTCRRALGIDEDVPVIVSAKHFVPKNGLEYSVRAMAYIVRAYPETVLILAGDGPLRARIRELVRSLDLENNIRMPGQVPHNQMPMIMAASDICVVPSVPVSGVEEATSIVALEAVAAGRPVIASNVGGLRDIIQPGGNGLLVPPANPAAIAEAAIVLLGSETLRSEMAERARLRVESDFGWDAVCRKVEEIYVDIAK